MLEITSEYIVSIVKLQYDIRYYERVHYPLKNEIQWREREPFKFVSDYMYDVLETEYQKISKEILLAC